MTHTSYNVVLLLFAFFQVWPIVNWNSESVQISSRYRDACFWVRKRATKIQAKRQTDRQTGRQTDRQTDEQTDRQARRQARSQPARHKDRKQAFSITKTIRKFRLGCNWNTHFYRLFKALYYLVFLFNRLTRGGNRERTGRQRKTEDLTG